MTTTSLLVPPFTAESAVAKVRAAEDAWNSRDPHRVSMAYSEDTIWRNRDTFIRGRESVRRFLEHKWENELEYRLAKQMWAFADDRIAVRFQYEYHNREGHWFRAYGNELWQFDRDGLMSRREASINDVSIDETDRKFSWPVSIARPDTDPGISGVR